MSLYTPINTALSSRGLLPMDGYCYCASCRRDDLDRNHMVDIDHPSAPDAAEYFERFGGTICWDCYEYTEPLPKPAIPAGYVQCNECDAGNRGVRVRDETTGRFVTDWCPRCDGDGRVRVAT